MFYYISVIAFVILSPMNLSVEEKSVVGPFPEQHQCEIFKAHVTDMIASTYNAELKMSKCVERTES